MSNGYTKYNTEKINAFKNVMTKNNKAPNPYINHFCVSFPFGISRRKTKNQKTRQGLATEANK
ncbi:hypothetical protein [Erwinia billingiae]|jgi:hypothetical protein|uniref:hypothetical protein n=1 Tax=Erwinia billingiae TaxID=182337 RepID=UPI0019D0DC6F|nr:hypothetical protein [Erwinia billingiae]